MRGYVPISDTVANREAIVSDHLDPGEAQAFALADAHGGRLLTDDGDARSFAKDQGVTVVGVPVNTSITDEWSRQTAIRRE